MPHLKPFLWFFYTSLFFIFVVFMMVKLYFLK